MNDLYKQLWDVLNDIEDLAEGGYRTSRAQVQLVEPGDSQGPPAGTAAGAAARTSDGLNAIAGEVALCTACGLSQGRTNTVPGTGVSEPVVMVIGEGPGAEEDRQGLPFVGPAGRYLDKWLDAIGLSRHANCYIGNVVKCRPPGNRDPHPEETAACLPFLNRQVDLLKPRAILTVGRIATQVLLQTTRGIGASRGQVYRYRDIPLIATYHPSGVLRNPEYRRSVWDDLKLLKDLLDSP